MLLILLLLPVLISAVTIQSTFLNTYVANGSQGAETQWQQNSVTIACSNRDARDTSLQQGGVYYDVLCRPPKYSYKTTLRLFVPHTIRRYTAEICEKVQGLTTTDPSVLNRTISPILPTTRRLLGQPPITEQGTPAGVEDVFSASSYDTFGPNNGPDCGIGLWLQYVVLVNAYRKALSIGNPNHIPAPPDESVWCQGGGPVTPTPDPSMILAQIHTLELIKAWIQAQYQQDQTIAKTDADAENAINATTQFLQTYQQSLLKLNETIGVVAQAEDDKATDLKRRLLQFTADLKQEFAGQQLLNAREQLLLNTTRANFQSFTQSMQQLAGNLSDDFYNFLDGNLKFAQQIRQAGLADSRRLAQVDLRRSLTMQIFELANKANADGLVPFWDPHQAGQAPADQLTLSTAVRTVTVDEQYVNYISGAPPVVHQFKIGYYCNMAYVLGVVFAEPTWQDILSQVGPGGCTNQPGNPVDNCDCWIQISHAQCSANIAGRDGRQTDFNWQQIGLPSASNALNAYLLQANPSFCFGSGGAGQRISAGTWDGVLIDRLTVWNDLLSQLCNVQLSDPTTGTGSSGVRRMQIVSTRIGVLNLDKPSNPTLTCKPNYDYIFNVAQPENNVVFVLYNNLMIGQNLMLSDQQRYESLLYGTPPNYITYEKLPFRLLSNNKTYTCHRASFVAVSDDTRPVFELQPQGVTPFVSVTGYTSPPVCDDTGCIFGQQAVVAETTSDVASTVPFENLLPTGSDTVVGEWRTHGIPTMTTIIDMPRGGAPVGANPDRRGTATYMWQPILSGYDITAQTSYQDDLPAPGGPWPASTLLDSWNALNPNSFNALEATISPDLAEVDFAAGQCVFDPTRRVEEWACTMFDHFLIDPSTDMRQGRLVLVPREWEYVATLGIGVGEILQRVFAGCPKFEFLSYTNGYQELFLTNSLPNPITVQVTFSLDTTQCPPIPDMQFTLQPKQIQSQIIFGCPLATINVYTIGADGLLTVCEGTRNVSYVVDAQGNVDYFTDATTLAPVLSNAIIDQYVQSQQTLMGMLSTAIPFLVPSFTPTLTVLQRSDAIADLIRALNDTLFQQLLDAHSNSGPSITDTVSPFLAELAALQRQLSQDRAAAAAAAAQIGNDAATLNVQVANQAVLTNATIDAISAEIATDQAELAKIVKESADSGSGSTSFCNWCTNWLAPPPPSITSVSLADPIGDVKTVLGNVAAPARSGVADVVCPILCTIIEILIFAAIFGGLACCCFYCVPPLIKFAAGSK